MPRPFRLRMLQPSADDRCRFADTAPLLPLCCLVPHKRAPAANPLAARKDPARCCSTSGGDFLRLAQLQPGICFRSAPISQSRATSALIPNRLQGRFHRCKIAQLRLRNSVEISDGIGQLGQRLPRGSQVAQRHRRIAAGRFRLTQAPTAPARPDESFGCALAKCRTCGAGPRIGGFPVVGGQGLKRRRGAAEQARATISQSQGVRRQKAPAPLLWSSSLLGRVGQAFGLQSSKRVGRDNPDQAARRHR